MLDQAQHILKDVFGYDAFRGNQAAIIEQVAGGGDALVLMPTGGGKSLCYQVPALLREGVDRKSTRLNSSHVRISYAVFCLKKKKNNVTQTTRNKLHSDY